ncbi:MAG: ACT domain-containing protein [Ruminococcaceae bacterium]|nr:ACT domain-containing protein [Oscillospiraceae bacterium]
MAKKPKYYIVEASALPEIFVKVAEVKRMLSTGEARTVNTATQMMGISRSAFYKYRDAVMPFDKSAMGRVITLQFRLQDEPGVLSAMLISLADQEVNILTINSVVPSNGCALVTITAEVSDLRVTLDELIHMMASTPGVLKAEVLGG